jgi:hypothetical protein
VAIASTAEPALEENAKRDVSRSDIRFFLFQAAKLSSCSVGTPRRASYFGWRLSTTFFLKLIIIHLLRQILFFSPAVDRGALPLVYLRASR